MKRKIIFASFIPLLFGALIYLVFRSSTIRFITWSRIAENRSSIILSLRKHFLDISIPDWFIYNLPDGLWVFGLTSLLSEIWKDTNNFQSAIWMTSPIIIAILHEFLQFNSSISGTFDIMDIFFYLIGYSLSLIINHFFLTAKILNHEQTS